VATFEELAERLAGGATPPERMEAAERLAELDDPRVAPALARALSDPDGEVRRRVEELLSGFARRDRDGHLAALLAEAERVAAALAAEAQRLRGEAPEEAEAAPVEAVEPPPGFEGQCVLVRLTGGPMNVKQVSRIVAGALRASAFEIAREATRTKGFLARGVPAGLARGAVRQLAAAGVVAGAAPADWLPPPLKVLRLREPTFTRDGFHGRLLPSGDESVAWRQVELIVAGRVELDLEPDALQEDWRPFTRPLAPRVERRSEQERLYEYVVEILAGEPVRRLRLLTHELDFRVMQRRPSRFSKVARLAREIVRHAPRERLAAGVRRLADRDEENWDDLTFISPLGYEDYVTWQRLLLKLGVPLPR
jgi:hypothetical protein